MDLAVNYIKECVTDVLQNNRDDIDFIDKFVLKETEKH